MRASSIFQDCWRHGSLQEHPRIGQPTDAEKLCQKQMEGERHQTQLKDDVKKKRNRHSDASWDMSPACVCSKLLTQQL